PLEHGGGGDHQARPLRRRAHHLGHDAGLLDQAREHPYSVPASGRRRPVTSRSLPTRSQVSAPRRGAATSAGGPCPPMAEGASRPPMMSGARNHATRSTAPASTIAPASSAPPSTR